MISAWLLHQAKLLEHNVRFGDPECECLMMRLQSDLLELLLAATSGDLQSQQPQWSPDTALTVILAAKGYPGSYSKGTLISGLQHLEPAKVTSSPSSGSSIQHLPFLGCAWKPSQEARCLGN